MIEVQHQVFKGRAVVRSPVMDRLPLLAGALGVLGLVGILGVLDCRNEVLASGLVNVQTLEGHRRLPNLFPEDVLSPGNSRARQVDASLSVFLVTYSALYHYRLTNTKLFDCSIMRG